MAILTAAARRALGILIHEMLHGEPPFGYNADDLPQKITAGLPRETRSSEDVSVKATGDPVDSGVTARYDVGGEGSDKPEFLPIVRYTLSSLLVEGSIRFCVRGHALQRMGTGGMLQGHCSPFDVHMSAKTSRQRDVHLSCKLQKKWSCSLHDIRDFDVAFYWAADDCWILTRRSA